VKVEDQVQFTHIAEVVVQDLHKQVHALQVGQFVVSGVHAQAEEQTSIPPVDDLVALELQMRDVSNPFLRKSWVVGSASLLILFLLLWVRFQAVWVVRGGTC